MKNFLLLFLLAAFSANSLFAFSITTQRVFKTGTYLKGKSTIALKGAITDEMQKNLAQKLTQFSVVNDKDGYIGLPTYLNADKKGFSLRSQDEKIAYKSKKGQFKWSGKESFNRFFFSDGTAFVPTLKAKFNGKGVWSDILGDDFVQYPVTYVDTALGKDLAGVKVFLEPKGANLAYSEKTLKHKLKIGINSKGSVNLKYTLCGEEAAPWFLTGLNIFTNQYDCTLEVVGPGQAKCEFVAPDVVKLTATPDEGCYFRGFFVGSGISTNLVKTMELKADTHVKAVFGNYSLTLVTVGGGTASSTFVDMNTAVISARGTSYATFESFQWEGLFSVANPLLLDLVADTVVTAKFVEAEYLMVDTSYGGVATWPCTPTNCPPNLEDESCRTSQIWFRKILPTSFLMGSPEIEAGRYEDEDLHRVNITKPYYIGIFEITQAQYEAVMGNNPATNAGDERPVEMVSYDMIRGTDVNWPKDTGVGENSFLGVLQRATQKYFDLPTEAQWEAACRGGVQSALYTGKEITSNIECTNVAEICRYNYNKKDGKGGYEEHAIVGSYLENPYGLYDICGNVWEWVLDYYGSYGFDEQTDPVGPQTGNKRILRGGSWAASAQNCRSARRRSYYSSAEYDGGTSNFGFRLALPAE